MHEQPVVVAGGGGGKTSGSHPSVALEAGRVGGGAPSPSRVAGSPTLTSPPPPSKGATCWATVINIVNNIVGAGMLSLPFALAEASAALGVLFILLMGAGGCVSFCIIALCCKKCGAGTYRQCWGKSVGWQSVWVCDLSIFSVSLFACSGFLILIKDFLTKALTSFFPAAPALSNPVLLTAVTALVLVPLTLPERLDALKGVSALGVLALGYAFAFVLWDWTVSLLRDQEGLGGRLKSLWEEGAVLAFHPGVFNSAALAVTAFACHYNAPKYFAEIEGGGEGARSAGEGEGEEEKSGSGHTETERERERLGLRDQEEGGRLRRLSISASAAFTIAATIFLSFAICGLLRFGASVQGNLLKSYESEGASTALLSCWLAMAFATLFTYPLVANSARDAGAALLCSVLSLLPCFRSEGGQRERGRQAEERSLEAGMSIAPEDEGNGRGEEGGGHSGGGTEGSYESILRTGIVRLSFVQRLVATVCLLLTTAVIALGFGTVELVNEFGGAIFMVWVAFLFPALMLRALLVMEIEKLETGEVEEGQQGMDVDIGLKEGLGEESKERGGGEEKMVDLSVSPSGRDILLLSPTVKSDFTGTRSAWASPSGTAASPPASSLPTPPTVVGEGDEEGVGDGQSAYKKEKETPKEREVEKERHVTNTHGSVTSLDLSLTPIATVAPAPAHMPSPPHTATMKQSQTPSKRNRGSKVQLNIGGGEMHPHGGTAGETGREKDGYNSFTASLLSSPFLSGSAHRDTVPGSGSRSGGPDAEAPSVALRAPLLLESGGQTTSQRQGGSPPQTALSLGQEKEEIVKGLRMQARLCGVCAAVSVLLNGLCLYSIFSNFAK
uniref:Amino acid transporter transmembrane domain-containing protein n=1 Tax=Chromera velia CCMP2878 TaxID=1169474 RepID=A0A0G4G870_9ALVE|eukprot:Cvel_20733.t1-p1 / transcript=Cvel_20733.t1 / gene=Cvel_20733 / organism=Chromera_velia_CCMP2878 / gene_product=hypothetical protein / transcript_product=hypothetical protein / location=Cvel_scaffold1888:2557-6479(+) / protein_length=840 / sequence_SO=supercontig / SO=protein_coding / is_pseudo=false